MIFDIIWMATHWQHGFVRFLSILLLILKVRVQVALTDVDVYEPPRSCPLSLPLVSLFASEEVNLAVLDLHWVVQPVCLIN